MKKAKVYFVKLNEIKKIKELFPVFNKKLGIKVHFGEKGNNNFVPAKYIEKIYNMLDKPILIETGVLYRSQRSTASGHRKVAAEHGFDFGAIDIIDGQDGDNELVSNLIAGKHFRFCLLAEGLRRYKSILMVSHFKGHGSAGFGGSIKNMGMGLACRMGKLAMHASIKHSVTEEICIGCGKCVEHCPVDAIDITDQRKALIDQKICISCSKCISVCPEKAIKIPWGSTGTQAFQERVAEFAKAVLWKRQFFYINFLINIVPACDCVDFEQKKMTPDIGILVSDDPVAIDQASYDLVIKQCPEFKEHDGTHQLVHAEKMGVGSRQYELINY